MRTPMDSFPSCRGRAMLLLLLMGCGEKEEVDSSGGGLGLLWYNTCGDPACGGYTGPFEGVPRCAAEGISAGMSCSEGGETCDLEDDCNVLLICADTDPTQQEGGCPVSRRRYKREVSYLSAAEVRLLGQEALSMPLARWQYTWEAPGSPAHVGFLIDDVPQSPAVQADGEHVDLYGYTSLAVAAAQAQEQEIQELRAELAALREEVVALRAGLEAVRGAP